MNECRRLWPGALALLLVTGSPAFLSGPPPARAAQTEPSAAPASPTGVGEVEFPHDLHLSDLEIPCEECHHETNAAALDTPHDDYLRDSSIDCGGCHREGAEASESMQCAHCHPDTPVHIADERLSPKVVIHEVCWRCHEVGRGEAASRSCANCHRAELVQTNQLPAGSVGEERR